MYSTWCLWLMRFSTFADGNGHFYSFFVSTGHCYLKSFQAIFYPALRTFHTHVLISTQLNWKRGPYTDLWSSFCAALSTSLFCPVNYTSLAVLDSELHLLNLGSLPGLPGLPFHDPWPGNSLKVVVS